jgi:anti-sigma factor RsiW
MDWHAGRSRLSLHADGELPSGERELIETHLATCEACRGLLRDLDRVRRAASTLGPITPPDHVWMHVAGRMRIERPDAMRAPARRERRAATGQWMGLAAALLVISTGAYFFVRTTPPAPAVSNAVAAPTVQSVAEGLTEAMSKFDQVIGDLERLTTARDSQLDPVLAETLSQSVGAAWRSSTGTLKKPWTCGAWRSSVTTRSTPTASRASAQARARIDTRGSSFLSPLA